MTKEEMMMKNLDELLIRKIGRTEMRDEKNDIISRWDAINVLCDNCDHVQPVCSYFPCQQYRALRSLPPLHPKTKEMQEEIM